MFKREDMGSFLVQLCSLLIDKWIIEALCGLSKIYPCLHPSPKID